MGSKGTESESTSVNAVDISVKTVRLKPEGLPQHGSEHYYCENPNLNLIFSQ